MGAADDWILVWVAWKQGHAGWLSCLTGAYDENPRTSLASTERDRTERRWDRTQRGWGRKLLETLPPWQNLGSKTSFFLQQRWGKIFLHKKISLPCDSWKPSEILLFKVLSVRSNCKFLNCPFCQLGQIFNFSFLKNKTALEVFISCRSGPWDFCLQTEVCLEKRKEKTVSSLLMPWSFSFPSYQRKIYLWKEFSEFCIYFLMFSCCLLLVNK